MKKILLLLSFTLLSTMLASCSGSSSSSSDDYTDPGFGEVADTVSTKAFNVAGESCTGQQCNAVIFQEKIDGTNYVAIGVNDKHSASPDFKLKIYWQGSSIPSTVSLSESNYSINLNNTTSKSGALNMNITANGDGTYSIAFSTNNITVGTYTINSTDTIRAQGY